MFCANCGCELPDNARFCMACGEKVNSNFVVNKSANDDMTTEKSKNSMTLEEFRRLAPYMIGYKAELSAFRKSLENSWDYNAFMGILLGVAGPKHGDASCQNFAIGQGDNGNNTKKTLEQNGLMSLFEKYKGKNADLSVTIGYVEDEIISVVPSYTIIRNKLDSLIGVEHRRIDENAHSNAMDFDAPVMSDEEAMAFVRKQLEQKKLNENNAINDNITKKTDSKNQYHKSRISSNSFTTFGAAVTCVGSKVVLGEVVLNHNIIEHKGYVYALICHPDINENTILLVRIRMDDKTGQSAEVLFEFPKPRWSIFGACSIGLDRVISILDEKLYYTDSKRIYCSELNGENRKVIYESHDACEINFCIAVKNYVIFNNGGYSLCLYCISDSSVKKGWKKKTNDKIKGYTVNGWINFENDLLVDVNSGKEIFLKKEYKYKKLPIIYFDIDSQIAYFYEKNEEDYLSSKFVGIDNYGNIKDVWKVPQIGKEVYNKIFNNGGYMSEFDTLCFNGQRMILKTEANAQLKLKTSITEYSRNGEIIQTKIFSDNLGRNFDMGELNEYFLMYVPGNNDNYFIGFTIGECDDYVVFSLENFR